MSTTKIRLDTRLHYVIDAKSSDFTVRAFPSGILAALGHSPIIAIRGFDGEAHFVTGSLENAALKVQVDPATFDVRGDVSEKDRREMEREMRQKVLEIDQFPQISFKSTQVTASESGEGRYALTITGDLALHGVVQSHTFSAELAFDRDNLRVQGEFSLLQSDYGMKPVSFAGGMLKLKDELKFSFDVVARKQE